MIKNLHPEPLLHPHQSGTVKVVTVEEGDLGLVADHAPDPGTEIGVAATGADQGLVTVVAEAAGVVEAGTGIVAETEIGIGTETEIGTGIAIVTVTKTETAAEIVMIV